MIFETHILKGELDKYIESIFHFKDFIPEHSIERVVPTGHLFIIFELDGFERHTFNNDTLKPNATFFKVWISGMHKNYLSISAHQNSEMFVIQFKPFGSYPFFPFPIQELNDKVVDAETVFGNEILQLREDVLNKNTSEEKFICAENWLLNKFNQDKIPSSELINILEKVQTESESNYSQIIENYSKTQKHLIDQFKKYFGLTPKVFHRISRFNAILQLINNKQTVSWSQIVFQFGYSDQSHFIKEFKEFSGFNPQEFIKQDFNQDETNFFPLV